MVDGPPGMVRYESVQGDYHQRRTLRKTAGWILLWALGVGAVISGDFGGWNYGLAAGGFGGLALATILMSAMYVCLVFSIAELSAALPHAGGFFSFTRNALGPLGGFVCGLTDAIEYILTPAVIVYFIGGYMSKLFPAVDAAWWWIACYGLFVGINIVGVSLTLRLGLAITLVAVGVLICFYVSAITSGQFEWSKLFLDAEGAKTGWLPRGWTGVLLALPSAMWFYLAIEQLPLAAEESHDAVRDLPRALILGIVTLLVLSILTLVLNSGVGAGAGAMGKSSAPLGDGFEAMWGVGTASRLLVALALTGLIASFHTTIYAYGRVLFALSRAGYIPRWVSMTSSYHTPAAALVVGAVIGLACTFAIRSFGETSQVGVGLLNMAVFGAVLSYILVLVSYIRLRITRPDLPRPYRSPLGIPGAVVGTILAGLALLATFGVPEFRPAMYGVAGVTGVGILYFLGYSRYHLVASAPEEENAILERAEREIEHDPPISK